MFTYEELRRRQYYRVAWVLHHQCKDGTAGHSRAFERLIDHWHTFLGVSVGFANAFADNPETKPHREHVVPLCCIRDSCLRMFEHGTSSIDEAAELKMINEAADFIMKHLKVVLITKEGQQRLDHGDGSRNIRGMKDRMPEKNWEGGELLARLTQAGIDLAHADAIPKVITAKYVEPTKQRRRR